MAALDRLQRLITLHLHDQKLREVRGRLEDLPAHHRRLDQEAAAYEAEFAAAKQALTAARQAREDVEARILRLENQLTNLQDNARKAATNREYSEMISNIEKVRHQIRRIEDELLDRMEAEENAYHAYLAATERYRERMANIAARRDRLTAEGKELEAIIAALETEREVLVTALDKATYARYEKLFAERGGRALAQVNDKVCSACNIKLRPRIYQQVREVDDLTQCESCQRVLYLSEHVPQTDAAKAES